MDSDDCELVITHEGPGDIRNSNNLDLNVEHDARSPKLLDVNSVQLSNSAEHELLKLGAEFESDEEAYSFYTKYAELVGFSVRKDWVNRSKVHGRVMSRKFTCSRQGYRKKDKRDANVKKHRKETRTGCLAHMVVTRQPNGKYQVTHFEAEHNHEDVNLSEAQKLLELQLPGKVESTEVSETDSKKNSEIQSKLYFQLLGIQFCTPENHECLQIGDEIYLKSGRTRDLKEGEAGRLLYYFQRQHFENPSFFYSVQLDIEDKISNIFWADDNMILEYGHFGDVVCLDTSATRNVDSRPFVQFTGLNHHRQVLIFGAAFLYDETVDSFKWLFRTFVEAMSGKKPRFILTDQDAAIVQAIHSVLQETSHCICAWQMYRIALKHLHHAIMEYDSFAKDFRSCIFCHEHEEDFINAWDCMLEKHGLRQNAWLRWMFREKEKWAIAYGRNTFFVEKNGTHLVEQMSDNLRNYLGSDVDVLQFFKHFESMVNEQRYKELESTFDMARNAPMLMANAVLLKHPSNVYTPKAFAVFQREYEKCLNVVVNKCTNRDSRFEYKLKTYGKSKECSVVYNSLDHTVTCNCMKFEHVGFLCSHALKVLDHQNIKVVPFHYILKRWTKDARIESIIENYGFPEEDNKKLIATRYRDIGRKILKISARAAVSDSAFEFAARQLNEVVQGVERILNFKPYEEAKDTTTSGGGACASEDEMADMGLDKSEFEVQDVGVLRGAAETESIVPGRDQLNHCDEAIPSRSGGLSMHPSPPETVLSVACVPSIYISSPSPNPTMNPLTQGLYPVEANHMVHNMYQTPNLTINQQPNSNMYEQHNFYSSQQHSPDQVQFLQESLIRNQFQESMSNGTQLRQVMDHDNQNPHSSSFMDYNHRYRATGV
ncbi:protein FAR1-RELATED SEQUENCE 5-like [Olea europaea var. sylvestris]|uniref:protein FAR1-RELATED SEQUENCE 5-like n=1 Tax=Olea europaea var. sylvestris TaxID=158386 RepID=UPI000C1D8B0D|nr:protein FAR1-RELATED SEQUENCE 5-like [Olea europaea var. sylvestris]